MSRKRVDPSMTAPPRRTSRGFRQAGDQTRGTVKHVAGKQGFAEADVLMRWAEIAGADLAPRCRPVKVSYAARHALGATLIVQASAGRAPEVEHLAPRIVERVNAFYGYRAISRLKVTQSTGHGAVPGFAEGQATFQGPGATPSDAAPTEDDRARARDLAAGIATEGLRAALEQLGANVMARSRLERRAGDHISTATDDRDTE